MFQSKNAFVDACRNISTNHVKKIGKVSVVYDSGDDYEDDSEVPDESYDDTDDSTLR